MATRTRRPGTMRERPPGSGRWQLRVYVGEDPTTGQPKQVSKTVTGSRTAAAKELAKMVTDVEAGRFDVTRATVGALLDRWLDHITPTRRPKTVNEYRSKIERHIRPALGGVLLAKLRPDQLDAWYRRWSEAGLSDSTVHHLHAILSAALVQAERWGWVHSAPTRRSSPPPLRSAPMTTPTPERLSAILRAAEGDSVLATSIALAALTGARRGELAALRWSDVDLAAGVVRFARSLTVVRGEIHEGPTKTHATRDVSLDEIGCAVLRARWEAMQALSDLAASPLVADPYVLSFNADGGRPVGPDTLTHRFAAICRGLEKPARDRAKAAGRPLTAEESWPYRFHDLRHFSVTTLIAAGVDIRTVAERHGHAQATMTLNRYAHALPANDRAAAAILGGAIATPVERISEDARRARQ